MKCENGVFNTDLGVIPCDPTGFATSLYGIGLSFIGVVALLFIVYGGFLILASQGNSDQIRKGKSYITYSIVGVVLAVSGYALYQILAIDVIKIPGFSR
mgnify:CR=1 FL=1